MNSARSMDIEIKEENEVIFRVKFNATMHFPFTDEFGDKVWQTMDVEKDFHTHTRGISHCHHVKTGIECKLAILLFDKERRHAILRFIFATHDDGNATVVYLRNFIFQFSNHFLGFETNDKFNHSKDNIVLFPDGNVTNHMGLVGSHFSCSDLFDGFQTGILIVRDKKLAMEVPIEMKITDFEMQMTGFNQTDVNSFEFDGPNVKCSRDQEDETNVDSSDDDGIGPSKLSKRTVAGIVVAGIVVFFAIIITTICCLRMKSKKKKDGYEKLEDK